MLYRGADNTDTYGTLRRNGGVDVENTEYIYTAKFLIFYYCYFIIIGIPNSIRDYVFIFTKVRFTKVRNGS